MNPDTPQPARISTDRIRELQGKITAGLRLVDRDDVDIDTALDELLAARDEIDKLRRMLADARLYGLHSKATADPRRVLLHESECVATKEEKVLLDSAHHLREAVKRVIREFEDRKGSVTGQAMFDLEVAFSAAPAVPPTSEEVEAAIERLIGTARHCELWKDHRNHAPRMERLEEARQRIRDLCRGAQRPSCPDGHTWTFEPDGRGDVCSRCGLTGAQWKKNVETQYRLRSEAGVVGTTGTMTQQPAPSELLRAAANILKDLDEAFAAGRGFYPAFSPANVGALRAALEAERRKL